MSPLASPTPAAGAAHPSRRLPLCVRCSHFHAHSGSCEHPSTPVSLVFGTGTTSALRMRALDGACGIEGWLYMARRG